MSSQRCRRAASTAEPAGPRVVADVVVAGNRVPGNRQAVELPAAVLQIAAVTCSVERQIAEVDDEVSTGRVDMAKHGVPVRPRFRRGRR